MKYRLIRAAFYSAIWAIHPGKLAEMEAFLRLKADGGEVSAEEIAEIMAARRAGGVQVYGKTAVLPVFGTLAQRVGGLEAASGGISTEKIGASLDGLMADRSVKNVVMVYDSPGGSVQGIPELAQKIRGYRSEKKIIGVADPMAASAALWLMAQATESYVSPSGQVGSVGVIAMHQDTSKQEEMEGVKTTIVTSSPYKAEMASSQPLTEEARGELEAKVREYHGMFISDIAKGRGISAANVEKNFGQGRMLTASQAKAAGMVDGIANLETVLRRLGADSSSGGMAAQAPEDLGERMKLAKAARARAIEVENS